MDLIDTPGAADANSYVNIDYADAYFETRLNSGSWIDEDDEDLKIAALIQATRVLDSVFDWNGWLSADNQALRWPRDGAINYDQAFGPSSMYDFDSTLTAYYDRTIVPKPIKEATCEMAIFLIESQGYRAEVNDLKSVKVGPLKIDFNDKVSNYSLPNVVMEMLRHMGSYTGTTGGNAISTPTLVRV